MLRNAVLGADFRAIDGNPKENFLLLPKREWCMTSEFLGQKGDSGLETADVVNPPHQIQ